MQMLTPRLIEAYRAVSGGLEPRLSEDYEHFRVETTLGRAAVRSLDYAKIEAASAIVSPELQKTYLDISSLPSHRIASQEPNWKDRLRGYVADAEPLQEPWTADLSVTILKQGVAGAAGLDREQFRVFPIFQLSTLFRKRHLPLKDQFLALFPDQDRKTIFVLFDREVFFDGPFLSVTDWAHLKDVGYSAPAFADAAKGVEMIQRECAWQGIDRVYLPEYFEFTQASGDLAELGAWLRSLKGALSLFAIANVSGLDGRQAQLTFWGVSKRQITVNGSALLNEATADGCDDLYSWIYRDVPHPSAALTISRNLVTQHLGPDPAMNLRSLELWLPEILSSAKANYAGFVQEKLKDFFELGKEVSHYTNSAAESLHKFLNELNESLRKSVFTTLGVTGGVLLSTTAVQLNGKTYSAILIGYGLFLVFFNVWYLPRTTTSEFRDNLRRFRSGLEPYREFLNPEQRREILEEMPIQNERRFLKTRRFVRIANCALGSLVLGLSGYDVPSVAKSFKFVPTWALGRAIDSLARFAIRHL